MKRIIFIGYMGAGKTTLGKALAKRIGVEFFDLDWYIQNRRHKSIHEIFKEEGEEAFRKVEHYLLHEVAEFEDVVISCGGGTPCFFDNMEYLNAQGDTIYLKATPGILYEHLKMGNDVRPLISGKEPGEAIAYIGQQINEREKFYNQAKYIFNVNLLNSYDKIENAVENICRTLQLNVADYK